MRSSGLRRVWTRRRSARDAKTVAAVERKLQVISEAVEKFPRRSHSALPHVLYALADTFLRVSLGGYIEQALIGFSVLYDGRSIPLHRKHYWALAFLQLFQKLTRATPECRQRLNIFRDVKHGPPYTVTSKSVG